MDAAPDATMEKYAQLSERYKIHIGFAEHYELANFDTATGRQNNLKLNPETISDYLEEVDSLKEQYKHISSGLELEYYPHREDQLREFLDDYRNEIDLFIGSTHEIEDFKAITEIDGFNWLINKHGSFSAVLSLYLKKLENLIQSRLFDIIAHPDVIFRFLSEKHPSFKKEYRNFTPILEYGYLTHKTEALYEINLSGTHYPWNQFFPNMDVFHHLIANDVQFSIGSDSHSPAQFENKITDIRKINNIIRNDWKFRKKF